MSGLLRALFVPLVLVLAFSGSAARADPVIGLACSDDHVDLRGDWGSARFRVAIADTDATRAQGLMFVEHLPRWAGMLFVFDGPGHRAFWMMNTLIELDMLFVTPEGRVAHVHHRAIPHDRTPISGGDGIQYVLEINGGVARDLGITPGSVLRHPRLDPAIAAWPCD